MVMFDVLLKVREEKTPLDREMIIFISKKTLFPNILKTECG